MSNGQSKDLKEEFPVKTNDSKTKIWKIYDFYSFSVDACYKAVTILLSAQIQNSPFQFICDGWACVLVFNFHIPAFEYRLLASPLLAPLIQLMNQNRKCKNLDAELV